MSRNGEKGDAIVDMARMIKRTGYNKDVILSMATVTKTAPLTVRVEGNGLETRNLKPMAHLVPQYVPAQIVFNDELGSRNATIMMDNGLELGDVVYCIYEARNGRLSGFIIGKEE